MSSHARGVRNPGYDGQDSGLKADLGIEHFVNRRD